jgi:hypothetical protein
MKRNLKNLKRGARSGYSSASTTESEAERQERYFLPKWRNPPPAKDLPLPNFEIGVCK